MLSSGGELKLAHGIVRGIQCVEESLMFWQCSSTLQSRSKTYYARTHLQEFVPRSSFKEDLPDVTLEEVRACVYDIYATLHTD